MTSSPRHISPSLKALIKRSPLGSVSPSRRGNALLFPLLPSDAANIVLSLKKDMALPLKTMFALDERKESGVFRVCYVFGAPKHDTFLVPYIDIAPDAPAFESLARRDREFSMYEREIYTFFGIDPAGHPEKERIILHPENFPESVYPLRKDIHWNARPQRSEPSANFAFAAKTYGGEGVYEIPVGPVHAGIIEPGHFRFSVLGEEVLMLEPRLGYVHKGVEKLFETLSLGRAVMLAERVSGDSSFSHALALCQSLEALADVTVPKRAALLRVVYAELERLANHAGDIGFIMLDAGFSFGGAEGSRIRERLLRLNERISGNRFLRGVAVPGGVATDITPTFAAELVEDLGALEKAFTRFVEVSLESDSLLNRLEGTGTLTSDIAKDHGVVGVAARAVGQAVDSRKDFPYAAYPSLRFSVPTENGGDVHARFAVRVAEAEESFSLINQALEKLQNEPSPLCAPFPDRLPANSFGIGIAEGFRGDIVYASVSDGAGALARVKVRDPSFLIWPAFPYSAPADVVPDFPLINKSYNLSYSGNDL